MSVSWEFDSSGFDEMQRRLAQLGSNPEVTLEDLITPQFLAEHGSPIGLQEWIDASGYDFKADEDVSSLEDPDLDAYVARTTDFEDWGSLLQAAFADYVGRQFED